VKRNARQEPAFIIWSIPTKRTLADAAGKAGDADGGRHARQHVKKLGGHRRRLSASLFLKNLHLELH
jgi:hypothetical protein